MDVRHWLCHLRVLIHACDATRPPGCRHAILLLLASHSQVTQQPNVQDASCYQDRPSFTMAGHFSRHTALAFSSCLWQTHSTRFRALAE